MPPQYYDTFWDAYDEWKMERAWWSENILFYYDRLYNRYNSLIKCFHSNYLTNVKATTLNKFQFSYTLWSDQCTETLKRKQLESKRK